MKTSTYFATLQRWQWKRVLLQTTAITLFYVSLTASGVIAQAYFNQLSDLAGGLSLSVIVLLTLLNALVGAGGLGSANMIGVAYRAHHRAIHHKNMFQRLLSVPRPFGSLSSGVALNTFRDDVDATMEWTIAMQDLVGLCAATLFAFVMMLRASVFVTVGVFVPLLVIMFLTNRLSHRIDSYRRERREATGEVTELIGEMFGAVQAIQLANAEMAVMDEFAQRNERRKQTAVRDRVLTRVIEAVSGNTVTIGVALTLLMSAYAMQAGTFTIGDFALFAANIWPVSELLSSIGEMIAGYKQSTVSVERMQTLMQSAPEAQLVRPTEVYLSQPCPDVPFVAKKPEHHLQTLAVSGLSYQHSADSGVQEICFTLARGEFVVITGRVGAGKSTLLKLLLGLLSKEQGEIYWNGERVTEPDRFFVPPRAAYTPQSPRLFSESVRQNILLGLPEDKVDIEAAIYQAVLEPDIAEMAQGLETVLGARGQRLSGGQIQRTATARMLVRQPELYLFDDLSSALDIDTEQKLWDRLFADGKRTCLVVSHRKTVLQRADRILVLQNGRLVDEGTLPELLARCDEMIALWYGDI